MSIKINHRLGTIEADSTVYDATGVQTNTDYTVTTSVSNSAIVCNGSSSVDMYFNGIATFKVGSPGGAGAVAIHEGDVAGDAGARILYFTDSGDAIKASIASGSNSGDLIISNNVSNKDIAITPSGTGNVIIGTLQFDGDGAAGAGQDGYVLTYDHGTGLVSLEAAAGGGLTGTVANDQVVVGTGTSSVDSSASLTFDGTTLVAPNISASGDITLTGTTPTLELRDAGEIHFRDTVGTAEGIHLENTGTTTATPILSVNSTAATPRVDFRDGMDVRVYDSANSDGASLSQTRTSAPISFDFTGLGTVDSFYFTDPISMLEQSAAAADLAGRGQFWVRNDAPNVPMFTDDAGTDSLLNSYELISSGSVSSVASLEITDLSSTYAAYDIVLDNVQPATDNRIFRMQVSTNNGSTWVTTSSYAYGYHYVYNSGSPNDIAVSSLAAVAIDFINVMGNAGSENGAFTVRVYNPTSTADYTRVTSSFSVFDAFSAMRVGVGGGFYKATTAVDAIRFLFSSGNIAHANYSVYGLRA